MTLVDLLPAIRSLSLSEKVRLLRILAEELEAAQTDLAFEAKGVYHLTTPYEAYGVARRLMEEVGRPDDAERAV